MHAFRRGGVIFKAGSELAVDASGTKNSEALITHAHSDHAKPVHGSTYYLTPETLSLIPSIGRGGISSREVPFGKNFEVNGFSCSFHSSGHILGSAQLEIANGVEAVFTSDFRLQDSILFKGADILPAELLIIETTFGTPEYSFPDRQEVYNDMAKWVSAKKKNNSFIILGGYATGKAQELTRIVNEFLGEAPLVHKKIFDQNQAYEKNGVKLGGYLELNHNLNDSGILILPPHLISPDLLFALRHQLKRNVEAAIATGWKFRSRYKTFPLSDHADFNGLLEYVRESGAKRVLTTHGFEEEFAGYVRKKLGIHARPLSRDSQYALGDFQSN